MKKYMNQVFPVEKAMIDNRGFIYCPICQGKTKTKVNKDTVLHNFPLFCPKCKQESRIDVEGGEMKLSMK